MSKRQWLMVLGAFIILMPFLGFPAGFDAVILVAIGILIIAIAYRLVPKQVTDQSEKEFNKESLSTDK